MIKADSLITDIGTLITPVGQAPLLKEKLGSLTIMKDVAIASKDGLIVWIGPSDKARTEVELEGSYHSVGGFTVMPGFIDPHTHPVFAGKRSDEFNMRIQGKSYKDIAAAGGGILNTVRATRSADKDDLMASGWDRLNRMVSEGITTIEAKSGYGLDVESEIKQLEAIHELNKRHPIDLIPTFLGAHEYPPEYKNDHAGYIRLLTEELIPLVKEKNLARFCDIFTEDGVFSVEESRKIMTKAKELGFGLKFHADELTDLGGASLAAEMGAVSADHLMFISDRGIEDMARSGTAAVLLPGTSFFLMMNRYAPARKMIEQGVPVALATDFNPCSSHTQSMSMIVTLACLNMKMTIEEAINASTLNAAYAIGLADDRGSIEVGKLADMTVFDFKDFHDLVYNWGVSHIEKVIKRGKVVFVRSYIYLKGSGPSAGAIVL
jgi:imidazolonepropionase